MQRMGGKAKKQGPVQLAQAYSEADARYREALAAVEDARMERDRAWRALLEAGPGDGQTSPVADSSGQAHRLFVRAVENARRKGDSLGDLAKKLGTSYPSFITWRKGAKPRRKSRLAIEKVLAIPADLPW